MSAPARPWLLEALVEAHARELHLPAIRQRFRALAASDRSSRRRWPTSPRCWSKVTQRAPNAANVAACSTPPFPS